MAVLASSVSSFHPPLPHPRLPATLCAPQGSSFECSQGEVKSLPQITADISVILALHGKPTGCLIHTAPYNSDPSSTLCPPLLHKESSMHRNFYSIYLPSVLFMYPFCMQRGKTKEVPLNNYILSSAERRLAASDAYY